MSKMVVIIVNVLCVTVALQPGLFLPSTDLFWDENIVLAEIRFIFVSPVIRLKKNILEQSWSTAEELLQRQAKSQVVIDCAAALQTQWCRHCWPDWRTFTLQVLTGPNQKPKHYPAVRDHFFKTSYRSCGKKWAFQQRSWRIFPSN